MFDLKVKTDDATKRVKAAADTAAFRNLGHAVASISKDVKASLEKADGPSPPGKPPHTHRGTFLRRAVRFASEPPSSPVKSAVVGPMASVVGTSGAAHEFGGDFKGTDLPERPFMEPALMRALPRFADSWKGSIGE